MRVRAIHTFAAFERDAAQAPVAVARKIVKTVKKNATEGNRLAKANARTTARKHGNHYPNAFAVEAISPFVWEYGPDASKPQGDMSFEFGSRNQPPHLDLAKSADVQGPKFARDAGKILDDLY